MLIALSGLEIQYGLVPGSLEHKRVEAGMVDLQRQTRSAIDYYTAVVQKICPSEQITYTWGKNSRQVQ